MLFLFILLMWWITLVHFYMLNQPSVSQASAYCMGQSTSALLPCAAEGWISQLPCTLKYPPSWCEVWWEGVGGWMRTHAVSGAAQESGLSCQGPCAPENSSQVQLVSMEAPLLPLLSQEYQARASLPLGLVCHSLGFIHFDLLIPSVFASS